MLFAQKIIYMLVYLTRFQFVIRQQEFIIVIQSRLYLIHVSVAVVYFHYSNLIVAVIIIANEM